jgi:hypothetical protein
MDWTVKSHMALGHRANETEHYMRSDFALFDPNGVEAPLATASLEAALAGTGWKLRAYSVSSKCDQENTFWGGRAMWIHIDDGDVLNAGAAWCRYELAFPCRQEARASTPAFSPDGSSKPFTSDGLRVKHAQLMHATGGAMQVEGGVWAVPTIHWWRITLATQLMAKRNPDGSTRDAVVQAHLRWRTAASMEIYARYSPKLYADEIAEAQRVDAATKAQDYPCIDPCDAWESMEETERLLEDHVRSGKARKRKVAEASASKSGEASPRGEPARPPAAPPTSEVVDVGQPFGEVTVNLAHPLRGEVVGIPCWRWHIDSDALSPCTVVGYARAAKRFVVRAADDGHAYAFTRAALRAHLDAGQLARL